MKKHGGTHFPCPRFHVPASSIQPIYPVISWHLWGILILPSFDQKQKPFESVLEELHVSYTRITHLLRIVHSRTPEYDLACNPFLSAYSHRLTEVKISLSSWCPSDKTLPIASQYSICNPAVATNSIDSLQLCILSAIHTSIVLGYVGLIEKLLVFFSTTLKYLTQRFCS